MLLSINQNYLTPFLWRDNAIFLKVNLLLKIFFFLFFRKLLSFYKYLFFCLIHFWIFLIFSEKTEKNKNCYGFYRYFPRSRYLRQL